MKQRIQQKILKIILFNTEWGDREGDEHEKIIYYDSFNKSNSQSTTDTYSLNNSSFKSAINDVGLCEAFIKFPKSFGPNEEIDSVHGSKTRLVLDELEPSFWIIISASLPKSITHSTVKDDQNDKQIVEYFDEDLNDHFLKLIIKQIYETFYLFKGSLINLCKQNNNNLDLIRKQCASFFDWFLPTIKICTINLVELFGAITYLPLDNITYIETQSFLNHITLCDDFCKFILFLYNDQLIFSSLDLFNTKIIYRYLITQVIQEAVAEELGESFKSKSSRTRYMKTAIPIYLREQVKQIRNNSFDSLITFGDTSLNTSCKTSSKLSNDKMNEKLNDRYGTNQDYLNYNSKKTSLNSNSTINSTQSNSTQSNSIDHSYVSQTSTKFDKVQYLMNIYRSHNGSTIVMITENDTQESLKKYLDKYHINLTSTLPELTTKLAEQSLKITIKENFVHNSDQAVHDQLKYTYYSSSNAAYKTNLSGSNGLLDHQKLLDCEFVKLIIDLESDLKGCLSNDENDGKNIIELLAKTTNETWLVINESDGRSLYSFLNHKNANLLEASDSIQNYMSKKLKNILFIEKSD